MRPDCYRVRVPDHARLAGFTATGRRTTVMPGEHVVHRLEPKVRLEGASGTLRFLGADACGRDVHVPLTPDRGLDALLAAAEPLAC